MEDVTDDEVKNIELKISDSLKNEHSLRNLNPTNSNSLQQDLLNLNESSLDDPGKLDNTDESYETKFEHSYKSEQTELKTNDSVIETNAYKTHVSNMKMDIISSNKTNKSYKEVDGQDIFEGSEMKSNISNISKRPEIKIVSGIGSHEQKIKEKYQLFSKKVPSSVNVNPNLITVKFEFENDSFASAFDITTTIEEIKSRLCYILELEEDLIILENNNIEVESCHTLADLGGQPHGKIVLKISASERGSALLRLKIKECIPTLDVITVHLDEGEHDKDIEVEIENESIQKHWLGGYRNKLTGSEYHNAWTQTMKTKKIFEIDNISGEKMSLVFSRDTQTPFPLIDKEVTTTVNKATQMSRSDLYITSKRDKIITVRKYITYASFNIDDHFLKYVITIQRALRRWSTHNKFLNLINSHVEQIKVFKREQQKMLQVQAVKDRTVITGSVYPVKRDDFYTLFLKVDKWWKKEWKKICQTKSLEAKKAASVVLIEKEVDLIKAIEKHKAASKAESLKKEKMHFLEQTSKPSLFRCSNGQLATIDYLENQKAREFKEMYSTLTCKDVQVKDRLETINRLKKLFESHYMNYEYAKDLVSLIDRQIALIGIGIKLNDLRGLQSRIEQLFLDFLHQPEFNPSGKRYRKPNLPKTLHQTFQCSRCLKLLPASKFGVHVRMASLTYCKSCTWMQNIAHQRADLSPYLKLLGHVRNSEMQKCCYSAICFILQPIGMGYLTNVIWHGHSAISECSDISKLQHVRWLPDVEWAPWNTILLSDQEAKLHVNIPNIFTFYDEQFIEKVRQRHILARKRFIPLLMMDHDIRSSGQWSKVTDTGVFLHPSHTERILTENNDYDVM